MPGIECKFSSLSAKIKLKQIKILTSCHRSASKNPKDLLAGLLFFFFSSNRRSAVLKLYKSWYETLFFADRAVIAGILNSLDILLFWSVIRYTAVNCQRARNVLDFWRWYRLLELTQPYHCNGRTPLQALYIYHWNHNSTQHLCVGQIVKSLISVSVSKMPASDKIGSTSFSGSENLQLRK